MERTVENLKEMIRAGRGKIPAHKVIRGGMLVNVMSSEIYPADIAVYEDMIVAVGDVDIKVIGADNQILDTEVPARQMMEQIVGKLGIPPFLLGLSWSTTERMSAQQADILTSELEYYRALLSPAVRKICRMWLAANGYACEPQVEWEPVNLQDEVEEAKARLYRAQAEQLEKEGKKN